MNPKFGSEDDSVGGESGSTMTVDVDEAMDQESAEPEPEPDPEPDGTVAETSAIEDDMRSNAETLPSRRQRWMHSKAVAPVGWCSSGGPGGRIGTEPVSLEQSERVWPARVRRHYRRPGPIPLSWPVTTTAISIATSAPWLPIPLPPSVAPSPNRATPSSPPSTGTRQPRLASVVSAGVVSATTSRAVVLVFLDQNIANSTQTKPTTDRSQVEITLVRSGGRWLVDQVTLL